MDEVTPWVILSVSPSTRGRNLERGMANPLQPRERRGRARAGCGLNGEWQQKQQRPGPKWPVRETCCMVQPVGSLLSP